MLSAPPLCSSLTGTFLSLRCFCKARPGYLPLMPVCGTWLLSHPLAPDLSCLLSGEDTAHPLLSGPSPGLSPCQAFIGAGVEGNQRMGALGYQCQDAITQQGLDWKRHLGHRCAAESPGRSGNACMFPVLCVAHSTGQMLPCPDLARSDSCLRTPPASVSSCSFCLFYFYGFFLFASVSCNAASRRVR